MHLPPLSETYGKGYLGHFPTDLPDFLQALGDGGVEVWITSGLRSDYICMSYSLNTRVKITLIAIERI